MFTFLFLVSFLWYQHVILIFVQAPRAEEHFLVITTNTLMIQGRTFMTKGFMLMIIGNILIIRVNIIILEIVCVNYASERNRASWRDTRATPCVPDVPYACITMRGRHTMHTFTRAIIQRQVVIHEHVVHTVTYSCTRTPLRRPMLWYGFVDLWDSGGVRECRHRLRPPWQFRVLETRGIMLSLSLSPFLSLSLPSSLSSSLFLSLPLSSSLPLSLSLSARLRHRAQEVVAGCSSAKAEEVVAVASTK